MYSRFESEDEVADDADEDECWVDDEDEEGADYDDKKELMIMLKNSTKIMLITTKRKVRCCRRKRSLTIRAFSSPFLTGML